ncbi:MAG: hypothetical protein ACYSUF_02850 [Planctomycetota bacterium]
MCQLNRTPLVGVGCVVVAATALLALPGEAQARNNIREAFFDTYPGAVGTPIETVASFANHCGNCHYAFGGGGPRNPYGQDLETALADFPNNPNGRRQAVVSIENVDCDNDGYNTLVEVTDTVTFGNTPTFAGLTPANIGQVSEVDVAEIQPYLVPSTGDGHLDRHRRQRHRGHRPVPLPRQRRHVQARRHRPVEYGKPHLVPGQPSHQPGDLQGGRDRQRLQSGRG